MDLSRRHVVMTGACLLYACSSEGKKPAKAIDIYEVFDDSLANILSLETEYEVLGTGYQWSEGPAWNHAANLLYFTDVPRNIAYEWSSGSGVREFLNPSGAADVEGFREPGANGLLMEGTDHLLICNHGKRAVERLNLETGDRQAVVTGYDGKKFNSPNDLTKTISGDLYFTDPPYGLENLDASPLKEQAFNGVYKVDKNGEVRAIIQDMTFPNGIAVSPDNRYLYISQSDPAAPHLYRLDLLNPEAKKELWVDFAAYQNENAPGLPDGIAVDVQGNIFATGPGGIFIISPDGIVLGRILTGKASANCTFGEDGSTLFITNHDQLLRLPTRTKGLV